MSGSHAATKFRAAKCERSPLDSPPVRLPAIAFSLVISVSPLPALAFDVDLDADSTAQAYQLHSPAGAPMLLRRRLTETLSLSVRDASPTPADQPECRFRTQLRLDADFGSGGDELQMGN